VVCAPNGPSIGRKALGSVVSYIFVPGAAVGDDDFACSFQIIDATANALGHPQAVGLSACLRRRRLVGCHWPAFPAMVIAMVAPDPQRVGLPRGTSPVVWLTTGEQKEQQHIRPVLIGTASLLSFARPCAHDLGFPAASAKLPQQSRRPRLPRTLQPTS